MRIRTLMLVFMAATTLSAQSTSSKVAPSPWVGSWAASPFDGDSWHTVPTLVDSTLREVIHTSIAGNQLRVRLTNEFGTEPLFIGAASIAVSTGISSIDAASLHDLTFGGLPSIVIPPGAQALSDPVPMTTAAFADLAISLYLPLQQISDVSVHSSAQQDNYAVTGNHVREASLTTPVIVPSWYFIKGVDVENAGPQHAAVVVFGDSITDGAYATENANHRWGDYLAVRLHENPSTANLSVLNEGIGGNCILVHCVGQNALARFDRDVLSQAGVKYVIVLEGINDIGGLHNPNRPEYKLTAEDLEQGLAQLVARAHEHGIKVFGATLTPYKGAGYFTEKGEAIRKAVNQWILTGGVFDGAIDFDKATSDPANPLMFAPQYDSGDHLHPKDAGYAAMANSIDLGLFQ
ncbi:SGNH/GDSL hydrolase family protein [Terracidiphilus gabretensis]|uniref:SGNH/GDSL hydrolase family protein n=1 Tax=Terracidiphilus gabretensis TaxID=1577687 RepID=UPI00071B3B32|nr:SGNH/GDSL hydrolase family protein [Terracidiphilus gabretensis]